MLIRIGDRVSTKYGEASIVTIDEVQLGEKYGHEVFEANLGSADSILRTRYVVDLDDGHWVYGTDIREIPHE